MLNTKLMTSKELVKDAWNYLREGISTTRADKYFGEKPQYKADFPNFLFTCELLTMVDRPALSINGRILNISDYSVPVGVKKLSTIRTYYGSTEAFTMNRPIDSIAINKINCVETIIPKKVEKKDRDGNVCLDADNNPVLIEVDGFHYKTSVTFRFNLDTEEYQRPSEFDFKFMEPQEFNSYYDKLIEACANWGNGRAALEVKDCETIITDFGAFICGENDLRYFQFGEGALDEYYAVIRGITAPFSYPSRKYETPDFREIIDWYFGLGVDTRFGTLNSSMREGTNNEQDKQP
jgi:hypothetical protein